MDKRISKISRRVRHLCLLVALTAACLQVASATADAGDTVTWNENSNDKAERYWDDATRWTCSDGVTHRVPQEGDAVVIGDNSSGLHYGYYTIYVTNRLPRLRSVYLGTARRLCFNCGWTNKLEVTESFIVKGATCSSPSYVEKSHTYVTSSGGFKDSTMSNRIWIVAQELVLSNVYSFINANSCGYGKCNGPAWSSGSHWSSACASYGGTSSTGGGTTYGCIMEPTDPGSGSYHADAGVAGGGAVRIQVTNVVINGSISSTGGTVANGWAGGAGSGGAVFVSCKTISGSGSISATGGGSQANSGGRGAGGGGRIAVHYDTAAQRDVYCGVTFSACGGTDLFGSTRCEAVGESGSVYFSDDQFLKRPGRLVAGHVYCGPGVTPANELTGENLSLTNSLVEIGAGGKVCVTGNLDFVCSNTRSSGLRVTGSDVPIDIRGSLSLAGARLYVSDSASVSIGGDLTMVGNASVHQSGEIYIKAFPTNGIDQTYGTTLRIGKKWTMGQNAAYYPVCNPTNGSIVAATAGSLWMDATATANANGAGWAKGKGPGASYNAAGHGGKGGSSSGGKTYGDRKHPVTPGSGSISDKYGQPGGGAIFISTRGRMTLGGTFSANGVSVGASQYGAGPSSGGSVYLHSGGHLSGSATITANGGDGLSEAKGGGGGGRIAIWHRGNCHEDNITTTVTGGRYRTETERSVDWGDDGTIYWHQFDGLMLRIR